MPNKSTKPCPIVNEIRFATDLSLHPDFSRNPEKFALAKNLYLGGNVLPDTSFSKDHQNDEKFVKKKANISIGTRQAVSIFINKNSRSNDDYRLCSISVDPLALSDDCPFQALKNPTYLNDALSRMRCQVSPLLADPQQALQIGAQSSDKKSTCYISMVQMSARIKCIETSCLHDLWHPLTGSAQGTTDKRIELVSSDGCSILIENDTWYEQTSDRVKGVVLSLKLTKSCLVNQFAQRNCTTLVEGRPRLLDLTLEDTTQLYHQLISKLKGFYLPVPPEWPFMGKAVTSAKTIALLSQLTGIPAQEIHAMRDTICKPSRATLYLLEKDVSAAMACMKPASIVKSLGY